MEDEQARTYEFGEFRLTDAKRLLLRADGEPVSLTPKVFDTLAYLVKRAGKIVDKEELMREIWSDTIVEENNLNKNISVLRRVLGEKHGDNRFIATVPGRGYKFVAAVRVSSSELETASSPEFRISDFTSSGADESTSDAEPEIQNLKPEIKRQNSPRENQYPLIFVVGALILLAGVISAVYFWRQTPAKTSFKTLAVLPFKPLAAENRDEVLEIGMADTLIARLGANREIIVRPLGSVRRYGNLEQDPLTAGRELGVETVLDGSLQRVEEKIRVNARLIKTSNGATLWSATFDEKFDDILVVQDAISKKIAEALELQLSDAQNSPKQPSTENVEAYRLYLQGRYHTLKSTPPEIRQGIAFYRQAIDADPLYALAYAGMAQAYVALPITSDVEPNEAFPQAKAAALRALELDEQLAEAHTALGFYLSNYEWDRAGSEKEYRRAIELKPSYATAHHWFGADLANVKRFDDCLAELRRAEELDPLSPIIGTNLADTLVHARRYDEAIAQYKRVLVRDPNFAHARRALGWAYGSKDMYPEAIAETRTAMELREGSAAKGYVGLWLAKSGKRDEALQLLNELKQESARDYVQGYTFALIYVGLGEKEEALNYLEKHMLSHAETANTYATAPELDGLRSEPRFEEMLKRMNLPE